MPPGAGLDPRPDEDLVSRLARFHRRGVAPTAPTSALHKSPLWSRFARRLIFPASLDTAPCVEQRLDELARIVAEADRTGRLPPIGPIGSPPWWTWDSGVWDSAVAAQTASHFPRDEVDGIVGFYGFVSILRDNTARELDAWTRLYALVGPGRPIAPGEVERLYTAIRDARIARRLITLAAIRAEQMAGLYNLDYDRAEAKQYTDRPIATLAICKPIANAVPNIYGEAPMKGMIERARANPLTRAQSTEITK